MSNFVWRFYFNVQWPGRCVVKIPDLCCSPKLVVRAANSILESLPSVSDMRRTNLTRKNSLYRTLLRSMAGRLEFYTTLNMNMFSPCGLVKSCIHKIMSEPSLNNWIIESISNEKFCMNIVNSFSYNMYPAYCL